MLANEEPMVEKLVVDGLAADETMVGDRLIDWIPLLMVNDPEIDGDHEHMVEVINNLARAVERGEGKLVIGGILGEMADYVAGHFYREERLMEQTHFPELVEHIIEHWRFTQRLTDLVYAFETGRENVAVDTLGFLVDWFQNHILNQDMKIGRHLAGLRPDH